jgi:hypothetical protein
MFMITPLLRFVVWVLFLLLLLALGVGFLVLFRCVAAGVTYVIEEWTFTGMFDSHQMNDWGDVWYWIWAFILTFFLCCGFAIVSCLTFIFWYPLKDGANYFFITLPGQKRKELRQSKMTSSEKVMDTYGQLMDDPSFGTEMSTV